MADIQINDQEKQVKKLKRQLEGWREVILPLHSVLMWEKQWYPALIFGVISSIFFFFWLLNPPIFTTFAFIAIVVTLMDYFVPVLISHLYTPDSWNKNKEKLFEEICKNVVLYLCWMDCTTESFYKMRENKPRMYYLSLLVLFGNFAWVGISINNLLLSYLTCLYACFLPGLLSKSKLGGHLLQLANRITAILQPHPQKVE